MGVHEDVVVWRLKQWLEDTTALTWDVAFVGDRYRAKSRSVTVHADGTFEEVRQAFTKQLTQNN